jgi:hypothetical protein
MLPGLYIASVLPASAAFWGRVVQTDMVACRRGFAGQPSQLPNDDSFDNRDDNGNLNYAPYSPKMHLLCLVTAPARSWQCGGQGFESP